MVVQQHVFSLLNPSITLCLFGRITGNRQGSMSITWSLPVSAGASQNDLSRHILILSVNVSLVLDDGRRSPKKHYRRALSERARWRFFVFAKHESIIIPGFPGTRNGEPTTDNDFLCLQLGTYKWVPLQLTTWNCT